MARSSLPRRILCKRYAILRGFSPIHPNRVRSVTRTRFFFLPSFRFYPYHKSFFLPLPLSLPSFPRFLPIELAAAGPEAFVPEWPRFFTKPRRLWLFALFNFLPAFIVIFIGTFFSPAFFFYSRHSFFSSFAANLRGLGNKVWRDSICPSLHFIFAAVWIINGSKSLKIFLASPLTKLVVFGFKEIRYIINKLILRHYFSENLENPLVEKKVRVERAISGRDLRSEIRGELTSEWAILFLKKIVAVKRGWGYKWLLNRKNGRP